MKKINAYLLVFLLISSMLFIAIPVTAFEKEVYNFDRIWYSQTNGFNKNGDGTLILATTYITNSFRNIDYCSIVFTQDPFYFAITLQDELTIQRDPEGNIIYQEPSDGYIFLRKSVVDTYISEIKRLATKGITYKTITFQSVQWYRISVPNFNRAYEWKEFDEPTHTKWYTWGNSESISFKTRAMNIQQTKETNKHLEFDFSHPTDNSGQVVSISKSYLTSKGITTPYFEWGEVIPWRQIGYTENDTHYFINPEHFSYIGVHEVVSGTALGNIICDACNETALYAGFHFDTAASGANDIRGTCTDGTNVWVVDDNDNEVYKYATDGTYVSSFDTSPNLDPFGITTDGTNFWITSFETDKVYKYTMDGTYISNFDTFETNNYPLGIGTDGTNLWVADALVDKVYKYTMAGTYISSFDTNVSGNNNDMPNGLDTDGNHIWVVNRDYDEVCTYNMDGDYVGSFDVGTDGITYPRGLGTDGINLWVVSYDDTEVYKYNLTTIFNVTRTVAGMSESNIVNSFPSANCTENVTLKVPMSSDVKGIADVTNNTGGLEATSVNSIDDLINNTYWYDSTNQFVYIRTTNLTTSFIVNWTVNCTYASEFSVSPPTYLPVGHPFEFIGLIKDTDGNGLSGHIATTKITYINGTNAVDPVEHNCSGGNIFVTIATTSLTPGEYLWEISFLDTDSGITFKKGGSFSLSIGTSGHYEAKAYFNIYDDTTGTASHSPEFTYYDPNIGVGIDLSFLKLYVSDTTSFTESNRVSIRDFMGDFNTYTGQVLYYKVLDFFNNTIYPTTGDYATVTIEYIDQFIDIPIQMWSFSVKNMNHSIVKFELHNNSRAYIQYLFPYEPFYWYVFNGTYDINITYIDPDTDENTNWLNTTINIDNHSYYWIQGYDLQDIILEIQFTNTSVDSLEITITSDISFVNSTVNTITSDISTNINLFESNLTELNNYIWNAMNITDSVVDYLNLTVWTNLTALSNDINNMNISFINTVTLAENNISSIQFSFWGDINTTLKNRSVVMFGFYNTNDGLGLRDESFKVYINGTRLTDQSYWCTNGSIINVTVLDYYNFTMFHQNFTINAPYTFIDLGLTFHSWLFGNKNDKYYMVSLLKDGASRWWERGIVPMGEREFMLPSGNYTMRIYDADWNELYNASHVVNRSMVYVIHGNNLSTIIEGQSVITGNLLELSTEIDYALTPDLTIMSRNPPMTFSVYDKEGMAFGSDFYLICPHLITIATTRVTQYGHPIISVPMIPGNGSVLNGTVTIIRDTLYLSGSGSITWVNITYTGNGTLLQNTSYIPTMIDVYGQNLTINASGDISVIRKTKYNQVRKFDWTYYPFSGYGPDLSRAGWHSAGIEIINPMSVPLYEVYAIAGFSDESNPDGSSVVVRDTTNGGIISERGPDYDVTDTSIHFNILSMTAGETRAFTIGYYKQELDSYIYDEGTVSVPGYITTVWNGSSYNTFPASWSNPYANTFRGALYIKLNFQVPIGIDTTTMRIYDLTNDRELESSAFIPGDKYIRISAEGMGDVLPGGSRKFDVYFLMETFPGSDPKKFTTNTQIWMGITPFLIILLIGVVFIIVGAFFAAFDKKNRDRWKLFVALGIFIIVVIYILNAMGL